VTPQIVGLLHSSRIDIFSSCMKLDANDAIKLGAPAKAVRLSSAVPAFLASRIHRNRERKLILH
jgi:hypothetical protein